MKELTIEQNKLLLNKFPFLQPRNVWTDEILEDYDYSYILGIGELPEGWERLFLLFCKNLKKELDKFNFIDKFRFSQIKEKYASMRLYNNGYPKDSNGHVLESIYEYMSSYVCEVCGEPATCETKSYVSVYCNDCFEQFVGKIKKSDKIENLDSVNKLTIIRYSNGKNEEISYDCAPYWNEYLKCKDMIDEEFLNYILREDNE